MMRFTISLLRDPDGGFTAQCIEVPGAISEGDTREEALANIHEAIALVLEARRDEARRLHASFESIEVDA